MTSDVFPICLPAISPEVEADDYVGQTPRVAGWGTTSFRGATSDVLLEIPITVTTNTI